MQNTSTPGRLAFIAGSMLITTIATVLVITSLALFTNNGIEKWQFPVSVVLTGILHFYINKSFGNSTGTFYKSFFIYSIIIIASVLVSLAFYDVSYDGQSYHQETIYQLKNGWNPFKKPLTDDVNMAIYINHYAKGVELPQSTLYALFNRIEVAKATNFILLAAAFCLTLSFILGLEKFPVWKSVMISCLVTLNPITVNQLISTYVDGQLATLILCFFIAVLLVYKAAHYRNLMLFASVIIITTNIKFTGLVYIVVFTIAFLAWLLLLRKKDTLKITFITAAIAGIVAVLIVGYNPYIINTAKFNHPFYPLMGKNKVDIIGYNLPNGFEGKNDFNKFFISLFSHTDNVMPANGRTVKLKIPFTVNKTDITNSSKIDTRIAGFGPLFSAIFILSIISFILFILKLTDRKVISNFVYIVVVVIVSICIMPESWWARYIPQLWYLPFIVLLYAECYAGNRMKFLKSLTYALLIINVGFTFMTFGWNIMMTSLVNYQIKMLKSSKQEIKVQWGSARSNRIRFDENGIPFLEENLDKVTNTENIIRSDSKFVLPTDIINIPKSKLEKWAEKFTHVTEK